MVPGVGAMVGRGWVKKWGGPGRDLVFFLFLKGRNDDKKTIRLELRLSLVDFFWKSKPWEFLGCHDAKKHTCFNTYRSIARSVNTQGTWGLQQAVAKGNMRILLKLKKNGKNPRKWLVHGLYSCNHSGRETHRFEANKKRMWRARSREVVTKPGDDRW